MVLLFSSLKNNYLIISGYCNLKGKNRHKLFTCTILKVNNNYSFVTFTSALIMMQTANKVLLVRPAAFGFNTETSDSNTFQQNSTVSHVIIQQRALEEFDRFVETLTKNGIEVIIHNDKPEPAKPDAIFPNNWIGFHPEGKIVLYPIMAPNRRWERQPELIQQLEKENGLTVNELVDLSYLEKDGMYLEGTGSVVFDHENETAYCSLSARSDSRAFHLLCKALKYEGVEFESFDRNNKAIYHTNVIMSIGTNWTVVCLDAVTDKAKKAKLLQNLIWTGREIIKISIEQMQLFCGNVLELRNSEEKLLTVMSKTAYEGFSAEQLDLLSANGKIIAVDIPTIEQYGGGSARCMMAEIF